jgi:catechol 2,3-dioxygenase-like lactoylglutathione lyase family enzyme
MPGGIDHVAVAVRDPRGWAQWMCDHLKFRILFENGQDPPTLLIRGEYGSMIEVMPNNGKYPPPRENLDHGISHVAFQVSDLAAAHAALKPHVQNLTEVRPAAGGGTTCFFRGPEEISLQIVERPAGFGEGR